MSIPQQLTQRIMPHRASVHRTNKRDTAPARYIAASFPLQKQSINSHRQHPHAVKYRYLYSLDNAVTRPANAIVAHGPGTSYNSRHLIEVRSLLRTAGGGTTRNRRPCDEPACAVKGMGVNSITPQFLVVPSRVTSWSHRLVTVTSTTLARPGTAEETIATFGEISKTWPAKSHMSLRGT